MIRRLLSLGLVLLLSACGGASPTQFYTLAPIAAADPSAARPGLIVTIGQVALPPALDRDSFVTQVGPEQLDVSSQNRWAAPLDGIIRRVLAADLKSRMAGATVLAPGDPVPAGHVLTVDVNVRQFIGDRDGRVTLEADWLTHGARETRPVSLTRQAQSGQSGAIAAAMSALLAEFSDHIAAGLGS